MFQRNNMLTLKWQNPRADVLITLGAKEEVLSVDNVFFETWKQLLPNLNYLFIIVTAMTKVPFL